MTVPAKRRKREYDGNGATTSFATQFPYLNAQFVKVWLRDGNGVETPQAQGGSYNLIPGGNGEGTVEFVTAPPVGRVVVIKGKQPLEQPTSYSQTGQFPSKTHERALDRLAITDQEQQEVIDEHAFRGVFAVPGEAGFTLPTYARRSDRLPVFTIQGAIDAMPPLAGRQAIVTINHEGKPRPLTIDMITGAPGGGMDFIGGWDGVDGNGQNFDGGFDGTV